MNRPDYDVAIIGGGPAGASMAGYLAKAGVRCVVLEREFFPRPHVGESLAPSATRVFEELDFLPVLDAANFTRKYGAGWSANSVGADHKHVAGSSSYATIDFAERVQSRIDRNYTYHVDRSVFDHLLLQHAAWLGATVSEGTTVQRVDFPQGDLARLHATVRGEPIALRVRMVVDASGQNTLLGKQLNWKIRENTLDQLALHTWFAECDRAALAEVAGGQGNHLFLHVLPWPNSWLWQVPIDDSVTSIGLVTKREIFESRRETRDRFFWECVSTRPELLAVLRNARRVRPLKEEREFSYGMRQIVGDRVVLVGDAARFTDPIFSAGCSIALNSSRFAHKDVLQALDTGNVSRESFAFYESTFRRGTRNWYNFVMLYYRLGASFGEFLHAPRYRLAVLKLLQGDIYDEDEPEVLTRMREFVSEQEALSRQPA